MIRYDRNAGDDHFSISLSSGKVFTVSKDELEELDDMLKKHFSSWHKQSQQRPYNKREQIIKLFDRYWSEQKTKSEVFLKISKELNISFKAVEKAYYTK